MNINRALRPAALAARLDRFWDLSARKIRAIDRRARPSKRPPVYTSNGRYTSRGWTDWTRGFQFGSALLQFDATGEAGFLESGRRGTLASMTPQLTDTGVHDHGFNIVSTFGTLWRMAREGRFTADPWEVRFYELALKCSGAVQAHRWTRLGDRTGFIYSFNGPHSLFVDTIRSLRSLAIAHRLGHVLVEEGGRRVSLLDRLVQHARATAERLVASSPGRDRYASRGRVTHEAIFDVTSGTFRCPSTQQGYSPFTTWTRGLAWAICGFAEQLEFLAATSDEDLGPPGGREPIEAFMLDAARATANYYIAHTAADGIPYWDTGAPDLHRLGDYRGRPADPFNPFEPVDSSAAAIAAQGLLRLGHLLRKPDPSSARKYWQAGLTVLDALLDEPYLATDPKHEGLILHAVYHRPNAWDLIPRGRKVPCGEATMWGDYHAREAALYLQRVARREPYLTFWGPS